jgi:hypothetical protein
MSRLAQINQKVDGHAQPAGVVKNWQLLSEWVGEQLGGRYPRLAAFANEGFAEEVQKLEAELIDAFVSNDLGRKQRRQVEGLLLAVLGRNPAATAIGLDERLPLAVDGTAIPLTPATILDRAVQVCERSWKEWPVERRRREYLLLEFYDAILADEDQEGRNERMAVCLQLLAGMKA